MIVGPGWDEEQEIELLEVYEDQKNIFRIDTLLNLERFILNHNVNVMVENEQGATESVQLISFLGDGGWSKVYEGADGNAYIFTFEYPEPGDHTKKLLSKISKNKKTKHLPYVRKLGFFEDMEEFIEQDYDEEDECPPTRNAMYGVYQSPIYFDLKSLIPKKQFKQLFECAEIWKECAGDCVAEQAYGNHPDVFSFMKACIQGEIPDIKILSSVITESLVDDLELLFNEAKRYGKEHGVSFFMDIHDKNLAQDESKKIILLDILNMKEAGHDEF